MEPTVTTLLIGVAGAFELEGIPFPSRTILSSFALEALLESNALDDRWASRLKPSVVAGLGGGGIFNFSKAIDKFERPVCFVGGGGSPDPRDEAGFLGDDSLEGCRFGSDHGFCGEEAVVFSKVLFIEDEVGMANEKDFLWQKAVEDDNVFEKGGGNADKSEDCVVATQDEPDGSARIPCDPDYKSEWAWKGDKRGDKRGSVSSSTDPASCFFIEAERVNLAEPGGLAKPRLPLPLETMLAANLVTWDGTAVDLAEVSDEGAEVGGCVARGISPGGCTLGVWTSPWSDELWSKSDKEERVESGDGGSSDKGGASRVIGIGLVFRTKVGSGLIDLGVASLSGILGDPRGVIAPSCTKLAVVNMLEKRQNVRLMIKVGQRETLRKRQLPDQMLQKGSDHKKAAWGPSSLGLLVPRMVRKTPILRGVVVVVVYVTL
jgi:hypothetical protein